MPRIAHLPVARRRVDSRTWDAVSDLRARAELRLREAEELATRTQTEVDVARRRGAEEGRAEGLARLAGAAAALESARARLTSEAEPQLVALAVALARALVGDLALREQQIVVDAARQALERARGRGAVVLRAHPDDLPSLRTALGDGEGTPRLVADPSVDRGGAVAVTEAGWVDASVGGRLERLTDALRTEGGGAGP